MKLPPDQIDEASFLRFGGEAVSLLKKRDFQTLADQFGYIMAAGRSPVAAIKSDFESCLAERRASPTDSSSMAVKYFNPNSANLFAVVECVFATSEGCPVLAELVVTSSEGNKYVFLEQISPAKA